MKEHRLEQNTIVIFTSDNGTEPGQRKWSRATPFRGLKWSTLEGGNRVPCIARFPDVIPPGFVDDHLTAAIDIFPTLAAACTLDQEQAPRPVTKLDGVNVWPTWTKKAKSHAHNTCLAHFHGWGKLQAIRAGDWKLYIDPVKEIKGPNQGTDPPHE